MADRDRARPHLVPVVPKSLWEVDPRQDPPAKAPPAELDLLPYEAIKPRAHPDTRPLDREHVAGLKASIEVIGLLEPLVLCRQHHLLCGKHRYVALGELQAEGKLCAPVPVRILLHVDSVQDPARALYAEVAENEKRKDYGRQDMVVIIGRLREAGFHLGAGRPRKGQKAMGPALEAIVGKSLRRIQQILSPTAAPEMAKDFAISQALRQMVRCSDALIEELRGRRAPGARRLRKALPRLLRLVEEARDELSEKR